MTDASFDTRLVSESYIVLRDVRKIPFGASIMQPEMFAREVTLKNPAVIVENDCVIVCSNAAYGAFDAIEVMEFTAQAYIGAARLGSPQKGMSDEDFKAVKQRFGI